jgi:hypothetical protein
MLVYQLAMRLWPPQFPKYKAVHDNAFSSEVKQMTDFLLAFKARHFFSKACCQAANLKCFPGVNC